MTLERLKHHVVSMWNGESDVAEMLDTFEGVTIEAPVDLSTDDAKSALKQRVWERRIDKYVERKDALNDNLEHHMDDLIQGNEDKGYLP